MNEHRCERQVPASHPSLPGHFPGQPVVPGVVILDEVLAALGEWRPGKVSVGLANAKFVAPLLPEQPFAIELLLREDGHSVDFSCLRDGQRLAQGRLLLAVEAL